MKILLLVLSLSALAKDSIKDFNKVLQEDIGNQIKKDQDQFTKLKPMRGPASVVGRPSVQVDPEEKKIDKTVRQTGARDW